MKRKYRLIYLDEDQSKRKRIYEVRTMTEQDAKAANANFLYGCSRYRWEPGDPDDRPNQRKRNYFPS